MSHELRARPLAAISVAFAALGVTLPFAYGLPMFALYRDAVASATGDPALAASSPTLLLCLGMTGGSIAGKWIAHLGVARIGLLHGERWAMRATLAGLFSWLILDTAVSLAHGAWANAALINPMPPLLVLPALAWYARGASLDDPPPRPSPVALVAAVLGALSGVVIALGGDGPLFGLWRDGLSAAHFGGAPVPEAARALVRFFLGPIGGSTLGHFVLVGYLVRHAPPDRARSALGWAIASILVWFTVDSTVSLLAGAAFNVWMVNVPALALFGLPLVWAVARPSPAPTP